MDLKHNKNSTKENLILGFLLILITLSISYIVFEFWNLRKNNISLQGKLDNSEQELFMSQKNLAKLKSEYLSTLEILRVEQQNNAFFEEKINSISNTVGLLEKLSKTDTELLKKYSKVYFLNENYIPPKLSPIPKKFLYNKDKELMFHSDAIAYLEKLLEASLIANVDLKVISAYRSFGTQAVLKSSYRTTYGIGTANKFSADQGYSEHQLATTVDFTDSKIGSAFVGFDKTEGFKWLSANAHLYGFILSYPKSNSYYAFEPWHYRFVGVALATKLFNEGKNFYSVDQREIDQYLVNIFD